TAARARGALLRNRHAVIGAIAGIGLLLLLVSGLPWTAFWGERAQAIATGQGQSFWSEDHGGLSDPTSTLDESLPHSHAVVPWGQADAVRPTSDPTGADGERSVANVDTAIAAADAVGLRHPMTVVLPEGGDGVFSVLGFAFTDPAQERTVHVDQFGGQVVSTYGYADYPVLAQVVSQGIALHEGRRFGTVNLLASLAFCLGVVFLCVTGPLMWWRRRPRGSGALGAPRGRMPLAGNPVLVVGIVALGLFLPLFGASLVLVLLLDQLVIRRTPALRRWFAAV
ncbi:MAG: PepSY domain-containing protein, partial [Pseudonocardia sp.]|nr:PepSY domain-containing protein [Pseudonocardia sp.]